MKVDIIDIDSYWEIQSPMATQPDNWATSTSQRPQ